MSHLNEWIREPKYTIFKVHTAELQNDYASIEWDKEKPQIQWIQLSFVCMQRTYSALITIWANQNPQMARERERETERSKKRASFPMKMINKPKRI